MVENTRTTLPINTEWTLAAENVADVFITLENRASPVVVRIAESAPVVGVDDGHTLTALDRPLTLVGLRATQKVYVRAVFGTSKVAIS